jgi:cyanophycinase
VVGAHGAAGEALGAFVDAVPATAGLGLLPGAVVVTGPELDGLDVRLTRFLPDRRELVGYAVPAGGTLVLQRRRVEMAGGVRGRALIAPWRDRPWRRETLDDKRWMDLVLLSRAAVSRTLAPFPPAHPPRTAVPHGALVLAGGAEAPPGLLERFVALAGGPDAAIVFIPCASGRLLREPPGVADLRRAGARNVTWVHAAERWQAQRDETVLAPLRAARGLWFDGGRPWQFVDAYQNTAAHRLMHAVLERGGAIGGWSAGASIQADFLTRGDPSNVREIVAEGYERGLGFLPGTAVDQHFSQRDRLPDLAWLVTQYPQLLGIGLDEATGLIVHGRVAEVVAGRPDARVYFFGRNRPTVPADQRYEALAHGERYDLVRRGRLAAPPAGSN